MKPKNLEVETNREEFNISWTAPLTMENTVIDGYNVSVNGEYYIFTKDTEVSIPFNSSNSPCIQVEISAFNGLDGDSAQIKVHIPSSKPFSLNAHCFTLKFVNFFHFPRSEIDSEGYRT